MSLKRLASFGERCPWHPLPQMPARPTAPVRTTAGGATRGAPVGPVAECLGQPASPPGSVWGAAESGWDRCQCATSLVLFASSRGNTGAFLRDVQASGQEGREPPANRQGPEEETDGAEESARGTATDTRTRTDGEGPSPGDRWDQRSPAHAPAVHGEGPVELEPWAQTLPGGPWRPTKGAAPGAVQVARTGLNGAREETYRTATRLALTQRNGTPAIPSLRWQPGALQTGCLIRESGPLWWTDATPQQGTEVNRCSLCESWGAAQRGRDAQPPATSLLSWAACPVHTGDSPREAKSSGEGVRGQRLTTARGPRGESDGAEESEARQAVHPRMRTPGEGPSPGESPEQRSPAHAPAVHGESTVELEQCEGTLRAAV